MKESANGWTFSRIGGVDQVVIRNGADIARLDKLDQKLWAVLAMPSRQPVVHETLDYLDADKDGKIRVPDILRTIGHLKGSLANLDVLFEQNGRITMDQLGREDLRGVVAGVLESASGEALPKGAAVGYAKSPAIDLAALDKAISAFSALPFNGDGVIVPATAEEEGSKELIGALMESGYAVIDASGQPGIDAAGLDRFLADVEAYGAWKKEAESHQGLFPSDEEGRKAVDLFAKIRDPMGDYFTRCRVLAMAGSSSALEALASLMASILSRNLPEDSEELSRLPIALPNADCLLHLDGALHPSFGKAVSEFFGMAGKGALKAAKAVSQTEWEDLETRMDAYVNWLGRKPSQALCALCPRYLDSGFGKDAAGALLRLMEKDSAMAEKAALLKELRAILLLKRDFLQILGNFVNLDEFYIRKRGLFRAGRLFLDGRELELCLDVRNAVAHSNMAGLSSMYLIYCDLSQKDGRKMAIVAALTAGDADNIFVGRNGIFYDSEGTDWDAVITKIVAQPISIREAFFSPYKLLIRTVEEFAMKRAAAAEAANMDKVKGAAQTTALAGKPEAKPELLVPKKIDVGTVAAIGVALGSIGAMVTGILGIFFGLGAWMPVGIAGVFLLISGPSMILAYMKLRKRNIGPLLNAEGWAINGKLRINVPFGATLSHLASLPVGANRLLKDPFAEKKKPWALYIALLVVIALAVAYFAGWLGPIFG